MSAVDTPAYLLFEHNDGRHAVCTAANTGFTDGDPGWHRVGPVQVALAAGEPSAQHPPLQSECLEEIATLANRLDRECYFAYGECIEETGERAHLLFDRLRDAIRQIGWLADVGCGEQIKGDALKWMTSPLLQDAAKKSGAA